MVAPRSVTVLGATGSIGQATADVLASQAERINVEALVGGRNVAALAATAVRLGARLAVISDPALYGDLRDALAGTDIEAAAGQQAVIEAAQRPVDWTMAAIAGTAGLAASHAAASRGGCLALATKECIVSAGDVFLRAVAEGRAQLLPVDSEHNAIFQCLAGGRAAEVRKLTLTASGGPFRTWPLERMARATPEDALQHPTWRMGTKITIDSATMMNKALELIEAKFLFGVDEARIEVLVHPQSIVHGMIAYKDGSTIAGLAPADMRVAIAHTFGYPERIEGLCPPLDLADIGTLTFEKPDLQRFPALGIVRRALGVPGGPTVFNAANERAVEAFIRRMIGFPDIAVTVERTLERMEKQDLLRQPATLSDVFDLDSQARSIANEMIEGVQRRSSPGVATSRLGW